MTSKKHISMLLALVLMLTSLFTGMAFAADAVVDWELADEITINVDAHIQSIADKSFEGEGEVFFGTEGIAKRLEKFDITLEGAPTDMELVGMAHVQSFGDMPVTGLITGPIGTEGLYKRIEGVAFKLVNKETGVAYPGYRVSYQVHMQGYGWGFDRYNNMYKLHNEYAFTSDGAFAGTRGQYRRIEAVILRIERVAIDATKTYAELKAGVDAKVATYTTLADGDLSTQTLVDAAKAAGVLVDLTGLTDADKTAEQTTIDAAAAKVTAAQTVINDAMTYAALKAGVDAKVATYTTLADGDLSTQELVDAAKASAVLVDLTGLTVEDAAAAQATVDAAAAKVTAAQTSLDLIASAETAVAAYEVAPIAIAADVIAAEALGTTANEAVNAVTNTDAKTGFESRLTTEAALVAAARTTEETNAVALINNSTVFNILARLQAPILNLQGIDVAYATEYQAARVANFTTTKALIQSNVIDFVKTDADATLKSDIDPLNLAVSNYVGAINAGAQTVAIEDMGDALAAFDGHFELTEYAAANDDAYMAEFVSAGTLSTFEQVQGVIATVNSKVIAEADLEAAQLAAADLFTNATKTVLAADQAEIDAALVLVNGLDNSVAEKAGLVADVQKAQGFLDVADLATQVEAAQLAVAGLFTDDTKTVLAANQAEIDDALVLVNDLPDAVAGKSGLLDDIQNAQVLLNIETAQDAVTALEIPVAEQQDAIDAALVLVNGLDNAVTEKAGLLVAIEDAQVALDAANLVLAQDAVTALEIPVAEQQDAIDAALVLVNVLDNAVTEKAGLLVDVQTAQGLLDAANELILVGAVNNSLLATTMETALDNLEYANYTNLGSAKRAEVAALFLAVDGATVFETQAEIELAVDVVIGQYTTLKANVNSATSIVTVRTALQAIVDTGAYTTGNLSDPVTAIEAEAVYTLMQGVKFAPFTTVAGINTAAL